MTLRRTMTKQEAKYIDLDGWLVIDKPVGPSSAKVVRCVKHFTSGRKVGHGGTLDPLATGVLIVCLGRYTRLNRWLSVADKTYEDSVDCVADKADAAATDIIKKVVEMGNRVADVNRSII